MVERQVADNCEIKKAPETEFRSFFFPEYSGLVF